MNGEIDFGSLADWFSGTMAACAVALSLWFSRQATRTQRKIDARANRTIAMKTVAKLLVIINSLYGLHRHLTAIPPNISPDRLAEGRWRFTLGLEGFSNETAYDIDPDEFGLYVDGGELDFAMDLSLLARRHAASIEMMKAYSRRRDDLLERMPQPDRLNGTEAAVVIEAEKAMPLVLRSRALEAMLQQMILHAETDKKLADDVRDRIGPITRRILNDPTFPVLGAPVPNEKVEKQ